jgi:antitoxin MazE
MEMIVKIAKWGNSLAVRIPKDVAESLALKQGDEVALRPVPGGIVEIGRPLSREQALERLRAFRGRLPEDYRFDRDEANAR